MTVLAPSSAFWARFARLTLAGLAVMVPIGVVGGLITHRLAGASGVWAMLAAIGGVMLCNWVGLVPHLLAEGQPPGRKVQLLLLGTGIRFLGVLLVVVPLALFDWFDRRPYLVWVAVSYLVLLAGEMTAHVLGGRNRKRREWKMSLLLAASNPLSHVVDHPIVKIGEGWTGFTIISYHVVMQIVAALVLFVLIPGAIRRRSGAGNIVSELTPTGFRNAIEAICSYLRDEVARPALQQHTDRFIPYLWSVFFFILFCNLLGIIPIEPVTRFLGFPIGGTPTGNLWVTGTMAACTLIMVVVNGLRFGGVHYLAHFCPGPIALAPLMIIVEVVGLVAKICALAIRLFANMMAGHILLAVLLSFIFQAAGALGAAGGFFIAIPVVLGSVAINLLEIFVAFLQAFIFTFLTTIFISQAVVFHHDHDEEHGHDHGHAEAAHGH